METRISLAITALTTLGFTENEARVLIWFVESDIELNQRQIERNCDIRQPEVSITVNSLIDRGYLWKTDSISSDKGRPVNYYGLKMTFNDILTQLANQIDESVQLRCDNIEYLKRSYYG